MNINQIVQGVTPAFTAPLQWLGKIFGAIKGSLEFYISCFVFALVVSMFIIPLRGSALGGSEVKSRGKSSAKEENNPDG